MALLLATEEYRQAARQLDVKGNLPLHIVSEEGAPDKSMLLLLEAYPEAALMPNAARSFPLHLAAKVEHKQQPLPQQLYVFFFVGAAF